MVQNNGIEQKLNHLEDTILRKNFRNVVNDFIHVWKIQKNNQDSKLVVFRPKKPLFNCFLII